MASLAAVFLSALGLRASIKSAPALLASATSALVVAASIASLVSATAASTFALAASFSSRVRLLLASIAAFLALAACSSASFAFGLVSATGVRPAMALVPLPCSLATVELSLASAMAVLAA